MSEGLFVQDEEFDSNAPEQGEVVGEGAAEREWVLSDGTPASMSEFVRERFIEDNLSRKEISEMYDINYRTVYGATVNMVNDAEPTSRGRGAVNQKIRINADGDVVTIIEDVVHINNEATDLSADQVETTEASRTEWIVEQVEAGATRGEVAAKLGVSYGVVYNATKDLKGASQRHEIEYEGETLSRSEYIRRRFQEGLTRSEIAKELDVDYPVVWSALKVLKSEEEKYQDALGRIEKFAEVVAEPEQFIELLGQLKSLAVKEAPSADAVDAAAETEESVYAE